MTQQNANHGHDMQANACLDCGRRPSVEYRFMVDGTFRHAHLCIRCSDNRIRRTLIEDTMREGL